MAHGLDAWYLRLHQQLQARHANHLYRRLQPLESATGPEVVYAGQTLIQFCSNNYLGLADHPKVCAAAQQAIRHYGWGAGASRLVAGSLAPVHALEAALAEFKHTEAALVFPTGYMANMGVLTALAGTGDLIVADKLNHASLLDAGAASAATQRTFPHRHYARAHELLQRTETGQQSFLVSDTVFSMDGDVADLPALVRLAAAQHSVLIVDDAHGTGVLGLHGQGAAEAQGVAAEIPITIGTLSKALGSLGGFVAGPRCVIETLINTARSLIYTTGIPAACAAAGLAALELVQTEPDRRQRVLHLSDLVRNELRRLGFACGDSVTPIIPVLMHTAARALTASDMLKQRGLLVPAIRPPTVPPNSARLRISLMATHTDAQVTRLLEAMSEIKRLLPETLPTPDVDADTNP